MSSAFPFPEYFVRRSLTYGTTPDLRGDADWFLCGLLHGKDFGDHVGVVLRAVAFRVVVKHGLPIAGSFCQFDVSTDSAVENLCGRPGIVAVAAGEEVVEVVADVGGLTRAGFVKAQHDAGDFEVSVQPTGNKGRRREKF